LGGTSWSSLLHSGDAAFYNGGHVIRAADTHEVFKQDGDEFECVAGARRQRVVQHKHGGADSELHRRCAKVVAVGAHGNEKLGAQWNNQLQRLHVDKVGRAEAVLANDHFVVPARARAAQKDYVGSLVFNIHGRRDGIARKLLPSHITRHFRCLSDGTRVRGNGGVGTSGT